MVDLLASVQSFMDSIPDPPSKRRRLNEIGDDDDLQIGNENNENPNNSLNPFIRYASIDLTSSSLASDLNPNPNSNNHAIGAIVDLTEDGSDNDNNPNEDEQK